MADAYIPERGDFVRVVLEPRVGREQAGERPGLVLSPQAFNSLTGYVFIAPVTGTRCGWPFEVPIPPGGKVSGVVMADQTRSIDHVARRVRYIDTAPVGLVEVVVERVAVVLSMAGL